jgi:hypothetical protein
MTAISHGGGCGAAETNFDQARAPGHPGHPAGQRAPRRLTGFHLLPAGIRFR